MDCFGDFCLSCDRQTNGNSFCSQACRLAELDHSAPTSESSSPSYSITHPPAQRCLTAVKPGFYLPPAYDFSSYRTPGSSRQRPSQRSSTLPLPDTQAAAATTSRQSTSLSPSASQTSISSTHTNQSYHNRLSEQVRNELKDYASSFDQVRTLKRRISLSEHVVL